MQMDGKIVPQAGEQFKKEYESKIRRHNRGNGICRYGNRILL